MEAVFPPEDHSSAHVQTTSWFLLSAAGFTSLSFVLKGILALLIMVFMTHMAEEKLEKGQKRTDTNHAPLSLQEPTAFLS